jgi:hypothetical protein
MDIDVSEEKESLNYDYTADDDKILENEIESWKSYENVLREENRIIFHQMLEDIKTYSESAKSKGENFSFESMCMALIIQQQKMINELLSKLSKSKYDQFSLPS